MPDGPSKSDIASFKKKTLKKGNKGDAVKYAQSQLNGAGAKIGADGIFGSKTAAAVKAFQQKNKLGADGVIGPKTWEPLAKGKAAPPPPAPAEDEPASNQSSGRGRCAVKIRVVCPASRNGIMRLQAAKVEIGKGRNQVKGKTNSNGEAELNVPPGRAEVVVTKRGYEPMSKRKLEVTPVDGSRVDVVVQMQPTR